MGLGTQKIEGPPLAAPNFKGPQPPNLNPLSPQILECLLELFGLVQCSLI